MKELNKKTDAELIKMLAEKRDALRLVRFGASGSKKRNVKESENTRHDIARILTKLSSSKKTV